MRVQDVEDKENREDENSENDAFLSNQRVRRLCEWRDMGKG